MLPLVALLGRTNKPTCGVEDYCMFLGKALAKLGVGLESVRVDWAERGWIRAFYRIWRESTPWRGKWVLLQYTAGSWSRYGFPFGAVGVMMILRHRGAFCAVMFHEPYKWEVPALNWIQRLRGACQDWVIRNLYQGAAKAIFADPLETIGWLPRDREKAAFIPIGGNIPKAPAALPPLDSRMGEPKTVAVFCLSDPPRRQQELDDIFYAMQFASSEVPTLRLVLLGRGTEEAKEEIERVFKGTSVRLTNLGIQSAEEVTRALSESDAMLCVRGRLFPRRGSALAGIACGVPIIAYAGPAQQTPLAEAGVEFVPFGDQNALGSALVRVLTDENLQAELRAKNRRSQEKYFSWDIIARRHIEALDFCSGIVAEVR